MSLKHRKTKKVHAPVLSLADQARKNGQHAGYDAGKEEGYLRGRANYIVNCAQEPLPFRQLHVLYVSSGKGFPYSPLDEAIMATLQGMVAQVTLSDPRQPASEIACRRVLILCLCWMEWISPSSISMRFAKRAFRRRSGSRMTRTIQI